MDFMTQKVEILLAAYNGEAFLREQIDSILAQTDDCWHLTVSDDASSDATPSILQEYCSRYPDRISMCRNTHGFGNARDHFFHLMRSCDADYMFFCDQDDVWHPDKVFKSMQAMHLAEKQYGASVPLLVFSDQTPADSSLHPIADSLMAYQAQYAKTIDYRALLMQNIVTGGAMVINRPLAQLACRCPDQRKVIMHDWWIGTVAARFGRAIYLDESLGLYRQHDSNSVGAKKARSFQFLWKNIMRLGELRRVILQKKAQAAVFAAAYSDQLTQEDQDFLTGFTRSRSGPLFYLQYRKHIHGLLRMVAMLVMG